MKNSLWTPDRRLILAGFASAPVLRASSSWAQTPSGLSQGPAPDFDAALKARLDRWHANGFRPDGRGVYRMQLGLTYRTDPARVKQMTPEFLDADPEPLVQFNAYNSLVAGRDINVITCGPDYTEIDLGFTCYYKGVRYWTTLPWVLPRDFGRYRGRENAMLRKKDGEVVVDVAEGVIRSHTIRRGFRMLELETTWLNEPAHPKFWFRELGDGDLRIDVRPDPDWRRGVIAEDKVFVSRNRGSEQGWATGMPSRNLDNAPRALDLKKTKFSVGQPSPYDAFSELPVVELVGGSVQMVPFDPNGAPVPRERGPGVERVAPYRKNLGEVPKAQAEPYAFWGRAYDPPIFKGKALTPARWPQQGSMVRLAPEALDAWRKREAFEATADTFLMVDFDLPQKTYTRLLPPETRPVTGPHLRMIAAKLGVNDLSPEHYGESWLLVPALLDGQEVWYALAHLVAAGGDVITGREIWGWPTKMAESVDLTAKGGRLSVTVKRLYRTVMRADVAIKGAPRGLAEERMTVLGVQFTGTPAPLGALNERYVSQPWEIAISNSQALELNGVKVDFPAEQSPGSIGRSDAWHEFQGLRTVSAIVGQARIKRLPGQVRGGDLRPAIRPYLADRNDSFDTTLVNTSFLAGA